MKEFFKRWKAETPKFFKYLIRFGNTLIFISTSVLAAEYVGYIPEKASAVAGYVLVAGIILSSVSKLAVENKEDIQ
jgi:hypothetical protein